MTDFKEKPPTQVAGVAGFVAFTTPADELKRENINWTKLVNLPPFEMFVSEQSGAQGSQIASWVSTQRHRLGDDKLYQLYSDWHKAKGYWVNETPMGEVMNG